MNEVVLATKNADKAAEMAALLADLGIRVRTLAEFPDAPDVVEDGETCRANAMKKARAIADHTHLVAVARPFSDGIEIVEGCLNGIIADHSSGSRGFGYDPIFFVPELRKTLAELSPAEKNRISHRAKAFAQARAILRRLAGAGEGGP